MKTSFAMVFGVVSLSVAGASLAQNGNMMNGGTGGAWMGGYSAMDGYGGFWVPALVVLIVVCLVALIVVQKRK